MGAVGGRCIPGDLGRRRPRAFIHCRGRLPGSRGQGCTEARWSWGSRAAGEAISGPAGEPRSRAECGDARLAPPAARTPRASSGGHGAPRNPRPSREARSAPRPASLPTFCHRPSLGLEPGSDGAEMERPGDWGEGKFRVLDASLRGLPGLRSAPLPAELAGSERARRLGVPGDGGSRGCGSNGGGPGATGGRSEGSAGGGGRGGKRADAHPPIAVLVKAPPGTKGEAKIGQGTGDGHFGAKRRQGH